ncbi:MAG TPA: hypothetical protein VFF04_06950 [Candidatus Babeliales bacterium]|nr:hypothetical protein [Candidatus Babeliales bacterium]
MAINIIIVKEDLMTSIKAVGAIEIDDDYFKLRRIAYEEHCVLIYTIDHAGDTVINRLQVSMLKGEINKLRKRDDIAQSILDQLQKAAETVNFAQHQYLKFMGD